MLMPLHPGARTRARAKARCTVYGMVAPPVSTAGYRRVLVSNKCSDFNFSIVDTEQECLQAAAEMGFGVSSIWQHHSSTARSAGCMDYTGGNASHKMEFNSDLSSTWTDSNWTNLYQICKPGSPHRMPASTACTVVPGSDTGSLGHRWLSLVPRDAWERNHRDPPATCSPPPPPLPSPQPEDHSKRPMRSPPGAVGTADKEGGSPPPPQPDADSRVKVLPWVVDGAGGLGAGKTSGAGTRGVSLNAAIGGRTGYSDTNGGESSNN